MARHLWTLALGLAAATASAGTFDLTHSGLLRDASGAALFGPQSLELSLYDEEGGVVRTWAFGSVTFYDGYYSVVLDGVDADWFAGDLTLGVAVNGGAELGPRQPLSSVPHAQRAHVADRVPVSTPDHPIDCATTGQIAWDTATNTLRVCTGSLWLPVGTPPGSIKLANGTRTFLDGEVAASCLAYRYPTDPERSYTGDTGDGVYTIAPGGGAPIQVWCDMERDSGGWTLVSRHTGSTLRDTGAVGTLSAPSQPGAAKLSDAVINTLRGDWSTSVMRLDCGATSYFQENKAFSSISSGSGAINRCAATWNPSSWIAAIPHDTHYGLNTWQVSCGAYVIWDYSNGGCYPSGSGTTWVR